MARPVLSDYLQDYPFWLFDIPVMDTVSPIIFTPLSGFSSVTMPELTLETEEIAEGNWYFKHPVIKRASVNGITLSRGVTLTNTDFYDWTMMALTSRAPTSFLNIGLNKFPNTPLGAALSEEHFALPRRQLVLIQFMPHVGVDLSLSSVGGGALVSNAAAVAGDSLFGAGGAFSFVLRMPARAFLLTGCIPTRYKPGSDLDATSGAVSISELDVAYEHFEQINLFGV